MIKIEHLNKYYFKGKPNQIHVIDDTTMKLPSHGIVALLGPSGCGKTTLLNAIGGLDKVNSGSIQIGEDFITGRSSGKVDDIRNAKIGYIFQNFNLLDDQTVFENVAIALRMVGIRDRKVIEERVNYCLKSVGIYQFRFRKANALSGGQRQRVAIARAIVKNPSIIIADEPTGNLDSANTLEVMNIIKAISRERLVLLVTHERNIAEFYSDHVAEILDGKVVKAYNNDSSKYLDFQLENKIYLKDMAVQKSVKMDGIKAGFYSDEERELDIKLVIRGSNIYIDTGGTYTVIDENTNIEMVDDHYSALDETFFEENKFKYDAHLPEDFKPKYTSLYTPMNLISKGFKSVSNFKKTKKFLLLGFVFAAMFTFLAISNIMGIFDIDDSEFVVTNQNYITVNNTTHSTDLMNQVASTEGAGYVIPGDSKYSLTLPLDDFLQSSQFYTNISVSLVRSDMIEDKDIIYGNRPQNVREVVLDKMVIDKVLESDEAKGVGLTKVESFVGRRITVPKVGDFWISGVCDIKSPSLFADESMLGYILTNAESTSGDGGAATSEDRQKDSTLAYGLRPDTLSITKGRAPSSDYEAIASEDHKYDYTLNKTIDKTVNGHKLTIVGFYKNGGQEDTYYVSDNTMLLDYIGSAKMFQVYAKDTGAFEKKLSEQGVKYSNNYDRDKETYMKSVTKSLKSSTIVALILLAISLIEMYLMLRSSFLSRIKEVGIMRAIGLKKKDIYRMFAGEIVVITVITSIPGIALMYYILKNIIKITSYLESMYMVTPFVALISFVLLIVFNLLVGLIPVFRTLRKTPAEILARTDI